MAAKKTLALKILVVVNATGRQGASVARAAAAIGYQVRAHVNSMDNLVAQELYAHKNIVIMVGSLEDGQLLRSLFAGAHRAFVNTLSWGDEIAIGRALADEAKRANIQHFIYSSMPDHSKFGCGWPALPLWSVKFAVERYIRQIELPATFVYAGIYNNNFTSFPYPLFSMKIQPDGSFSWNAPFHPDSPLPWLDVEHDVGPAMMQLFGDGIEKWSGHRVTLAFELLSPRQVCAAFSLALRRRVKYTFSPRIEITVPIPAGYQAQLEGVEALFGKYNAPYFGVPVDELDDPRELWGGWRGIAEYAKEVFPVEEANNGMTWMYEQP